MKQSLMNNVIQYGWQTTAGTGTLTSPLVFDLMPCGSVITSIHLHASAVAYIRLKQDGKQVFPVRSNVGSQFYKIMMANDIIELNNLWIPINPNAPLTLEYVDGSAIALNVVLVMASEDDRSLLLDTIEKGINKLIYERKVNK